MSERDPREKVTTRVTYRVERVRTPFLFFGGMVANVIVVYTLFVGKFARQYFGPVAILEFVFLVGGLLLCCHPIPKRALWDKDSYWNPFFGSALILMAISLVYALQPFKNSGAIDTPKPGVRWHAPNEGHARPKIPSEAELNRQNEEFRRYLESRRKRKDENR